MKTGLNVLELVLYRDSDGFLPVKAASRIPDDYRGSTRQHLTLRVISDDAKIVEERQYVAFMNLGKAFDSMPIELAVQPLIRLTQHQSGRTTWRVLSLLKNGARSR